MTEMSRLDLVARLLAALSLTVAFLAVGAAPAAADAGGAGDELTVGRHLSCCRALAVCPSPVPH